ncbi:hypothetical protein WKW80_09775 [Variovorax humicola]|uniref:ATP-grasp domain-containing protein n=1 Tax=Variovorax humicola TaxID=1769758 RepID=A0ABU8VWZ1_9BURK
MTAPVLLWGSPHDVPLAAVCTALSHLGTPMFLVDQARVLETALAFDADTGDGWLHVGDQRCDLGAVRSAYIRPDAWDRTDSVARAGPGSAPWLYASEVEDAVLTWLELTHSRVVNRPAAMASNGSKPYQIALIRQAGFDVPDTLVTNDREALRAFHARHCHIVYKSNSAVRSIVSRFYFCNDDRLARLATCPTQFQQYIPGPDYRAHVIGDEVFGHRIDCDADDYRYPGALAARMRPWTVDAALADRLRALAASLGLAMAGIDLRRSADGAWFCFEVNPSPGFTFFDDDEAPVLARATARLLSRP